MVVTGRSVTTRIRRALAERGFVTFAPQNLYIFGDRFRTLQRKANPLGKTLFSIIVPQHQQIVNWLRSLPIVDPARIAFYGLSLRRQDRHARPGAGERILPVHLLGRFQRVGLEERLDPHSVQLRVDRRVRDLRVRPGQHVQLRRDGGPDRPPTVHGRARPLRRRRARRGVAFEFAKVRHLYAARLGIADGLPIEWFVGPHRIHGVGTFEFLRNHVNHHSSNQPHP